MVAAGEALPLYYDPVYSNGVLGCSTYMDGLPIATFTELYQELNGKQPAGELWDAYATVLTVIGAMQVVIVLPPETPKAAAEALQTAVAALAHDQDYAEEAKEDVRLPARMAHRPQHQPAHARGAVGPSGNQGVHHRLHQEAEPVRK